MDDLGVHQLEMDDLGVHTITTPILGYLHASIWDVAQVANHQLGAPVGWSIPNLLTFRVQVYDLVTLVSALKKTIGFWMSQVHAKNPDNRNAEFHGFNSYNDSYTYSGL